MCSKLFPLLILALSLAAPAALAQDYGTGGSLYLSFSADERETDRQVEPLTPFEFYLITDLSGSPHDGLTAFEASLHFPTSLALISAEHTPPETVPFNLLWRDGAYDGAFAFRGICLEATQPAVLIKFTAILMEAAENVFIEIGPTSLTSFRPDPVPGWLACNGEPDPRLMAYADFGQNDPAVLNRTVATVSSSWGAVKAIYGGSQQVSLSGP